VRRLLRRLRRLHRERAGGAQRPLQPHLRHRRRVLPAVRPGARARATHLQQPLPNFSIFSSRGASSAGCSRC
jgi:hypothetical protein